MVRFLNSEETTMTAIAVFAFAWLLFAFLPLVLPTFFAIRKRHTLKRKILFVGTIACLCYGSLFFIVALSIPFEIHTIYIAPQLQNAGYPYGSWLVDAILFLRDYGFIFFPPVILVLSIFVTKFVSSRWNRIIDAVGG